MPFTPSHIAAALPLLRTPLPVAPLVIGTMAPDVPYFLPLRVARDFTHSLAGVPTVDLAITVVLVALWYTVLRAPILDLAPSAVRERMAPRGAFGWRRPHQRWVPAAALALVAAVIGSLTHLAWDSFTHDSSSLVQAVPVLHARLGPFGVSSWLQYASSIGGLVALAFWARAWARRTPRRPSAPVASRVARLTVWAVMVAVFVGVGSAIELIGISAGISPVAPSRIFVSVTIAGGAAGLAGLAICLAWWIARGLHRAQNRHDLAEHLGVVAEDRLER